MEPLFEAKALYEDVYVLYNIFRIDQEKYKAQLLFDKDGSSSAAPTELIVAKQNRQWQTEDLKFKELGATLGVEIDAFNNGYGALLGRIGID
ncbi:MAG: hypothetical protein M3040_02875 [Bacteroidota bacterium]|nr:hypothetical protein [Bacteroidota bacterium]